MLLIGIAPHGLLSLFSYSTKDHSDILLHLIINQENALGLPIGQSGRGTLSIEVPNTSLCQANTKLYVRVCSKESAGWLLHAGVGGFYCE